MVITLLKKHTSHSKCFHRNSPNYIHTVDQEAVSWAAIAFVSVVCNYKVNVYCNGIYVYISSESSSEKELFEIEIVLITDNEKLYISRR